MKAEDVIGAELAGRSKLMLSERWTMTRSVRAPIVPPIVPLTPQQRLLLQLTAEGMDIIECAFEMKINKQTAHSHMQQIYKRVGFRSVALLTQYAIAAGYAEPTFPLCPCMW